MEAVVERKSISDLPNDELVKVYVQIRDQLAVEKKAWDARKASLEVKQDKIEGILLHRYQEAGIESARTQYGTAYKKKVGFASVADKGAFMDYVKSNGAWELLETRCSKVDVKAFIDENNDLPPGVNWREEVHIYIQRA